MFLEYELLILAMVFILIFVFFIISHNIIMKDIDGKCRDLQLSYNRLVEILQEWQKRI